MEAAEEVATVAGAPSGAVFGLGGSEGSSPSTTFHDLLGGSEGSSRGSRGEGSLVMLRVIAPPPSLTIRRDPDDEYLPPPSAAFHGLPPPSAAFHRLPPPSADGGALGEGAGRAASAPPEAGSSAVGEAASSSRLGDAIAGIPAAVRACSLS